MTVRNVSISNETYEILVKLKLPNEEIGDVIRRLCEEKTVKKLLQTISSQPYWSDMPEDEYKTLKELINRTHSTFTPQGVNEH